MKYELAYLSSFVDDMLHITAYMLESEYPEDIVKKFQNEIEKKTESLRESPKRFTVYEKIPEFHRMLVLYDYQVFYTINDYKKLVQIHHILHSHRNILKFLQYERDATKRMKLTGGYDHV